MNRRWYLSFVGEKGFLGACVVEGESEEEALLLSHRLKINPGGEVLLIPVPEKARDLFPLNKLMSKAELASYGPIHRLGDLKPGEL